MLDSLRADHLGCYGNSWIKTPNIDSFAKEATVFERAYAEGLPTLPVRTALLTGKYTLPNRGW
ncbi:MAG: sulfatase-like hydrolase/transferase, partial [Thermoprotei archaeon]|nr:sulfatase-like hydrolase/transferase [Thermoprotei archaeon]